MRDRLLDPERVPLEVRFARGVVVLAVREDQQHVAGQVAHGVERVGEARLAEEHAGFAGRGDGPREVGRAAGRHAELGDEPVGLFARRDEHHVGDGGEGTGARPLERFALAVRREPREVGGAGGAVAHRVPYAGRGVVSRRARCR